MVRRRQDPSIARIVAVAQALRLARPVLLLSTRQPDQSRSTLLGRSCRDVEMNDIYLVTLDYIVIEIDTSNMAYSTSSIK